MIPLLGDWVMSVQMAYVTAEGTVAPRPPAALVMTAGTVIQMLDQVFAMRKIPATVPENVNSMSKPRAPSAERVLVILNATRMKYAAGI
jgi:hypothetical protein